MAQLTCCSLKGFGLDTFCVEDYVEYVNDAFKKNVNIPRVRTQERFAGMVVFDDDTEETIGGFIRMCKWAKPSIICIDFSNITSDGIRRGVLSFIEDTIKSELASWYTDLESYEERFSFGLKTECRDWSDRGDIIESAEDGIDDMLYM